MTARHSAGPPPTDATDTRGDPGLIALIIIDVGAALPWTFHDTTGQLGRSIDAWEIILFIVIGAAAVALAFAWWNRATVAAEWTIRIAAVAWLAAAIYIAIAGHDLEPMSRIGFALMLAGIAVGHFSVAERIEEAIR